MGKLRFLTVPVAAGLAGPLTLPTKLVYYEPPACTPKARAKHLLPQEKGNKMKRLATLPAIMLMTLGVQAQSEVYKLKPTPKTVAWGYYDASTPPVLRIKSGDTVEVQTLITSSPARLEGA